MQTKTYTVTGEQGANIRTLPSGESRVEYHFERGKDVQVVSDFTATNTAGGTTTKYLCILYKQRYLWAVASNFSEKVHVDYQKKVAESAKVVYPKCIGKVHGSGVQKRVATFEEFLRQDELNCHLMVSLVLQKSGLLPKGGFVGHTPKRNGKKCVADAVKGYKQLQHCKVVWVNKRYNDLPDKYKEAGCVYFQNSNACISAGGGEIWSCNKKVKERYRRKEDYLKEYGYVKDSNILVVAVPDK